MVVRYFLHERLDGKGYPRGLEARRLELDARILTVCDVYDAFDPACVAALERVLTHEPETRPQLAAAYA